MRNKLEGIEPDAFVLGRRNKCQNGEIDMMPDHSVNDYIYRDCLDNIYYYMFAESYDRIALSHHKMKRVDENAMSILSEG
jgi:hypothetical protein